VHLCLFPSTTTTNYQLQKLQTAKGPQNKTSRSSSVVRAFVSFLLTFRPF
jgi:hypothetical protein